MFPTSLPVPLILRTVVLNESSEAIFNTFLGLALVDYSLIWSIECTLTMGHTGAPKPFIVESAVHVVVGAFATALTV